MQSLSKKAGTRKHFWFLKIADILRMFVAEMLPLPHTFSHSACSCLIPSPIYSSQHSQVHHHHHCLFSLCKRTSPPSFTAWCGVPVAVPVLITGLLGGYLWLSIFMTFFHGRPTGMDTASHNMYPYPFWMIMAQSSFTGSCVFHSRRSESKLWYWTDVDLEQSLHFGEEERTFFPSDSAHKTGQTICN